MANWRLCKPINPLRVGIDLDGVLAHFDAPALDKMRLIQPTGIHDVVFDDITHPDQWGWTGKYGVSPETNRAFWQQVCTTDTEFWNRLMPTKCCDMAFKQYAKRPDVQMYYITSRPVSATKATRLWLDRNGLEGTLLLAKSGTKGHLANALSLHCLIDDKPENLTDVLAECKTRCLPILVNKPWNKDPQSPYLLRVDTVREGLGVLEQVVKDADSVRA